MKTVQEKIPERLTNQNFFQSSASFRVQKYRIDASFPVHWHEFYEMEFILSGRGNHIVNGRQVPLAAGSLFLLTPVDFHEILPEEGFPVTLVNVKFSDEILSEELRDLIFSGCLPCMACCAGEEFGRMEAEFSRLLKEAQGAETGKNIVMRGILERMVVDLLRKSHDAGADSKAEGKVNKSNLIYKSLLYLHHHFREPVTLAHIARQSNLSVNYFSECFHKATGKPFKSYLHELRILFAASLLTSSRLPVTEICYAAGFNSLPHFLRSFKQRFGMPPNGYRKNISHTA